MFPAAQMSGPCQRRDCTRALMPGLALRGALAVASLPGGRTISTTNSPRPLSASRASGDSSVAFS